MKYLKFIFIVFLPIEILFAHRVNLFAYPENNKIYVEAYYSDGTKVHSGKITVLNKEGKKLLEGLTDEEGKFSFSVPEKTDLRIVLEAGMGHKIETVVEESLLPDLKIKKKNKKIEKNIKTIKEDKNSTITEKHYIDEDSMKNIIGEALDKKFLLLSKEINELKNKIFITEIIGGIGYIVGLMGIIMFFMSRKKNDKK